MPYLLKRPVRRRRRYRRKTTNTMGNVGLYNAYTGARWAYRQIVKLKGLVNSEMYKKDNQDAGTFILNNNAYSVHLTNIAIGDGDSDRTGNSIYVRCLNLRGQLIYNSTGTDPQFVRIALVLDKQQIADTPPTYTDVYNGADYNAHLNPDTVGRFKVLFSRTYSLDSVNAITKSVTFNKPMKHHVRYNGTTINDIQKGGLFLIACSSEPTNGPKLIWDCRTSYHDN